MAATGNELDVAIDKVNNAASDHDDYDVIGGGGEFIQAHEELVLQEDWWWAVHLCLCSVAIIGNLLFIITIIYNRKRQDLKTFATAVIVTIACLDVLDIGRIIPVLVESLFKNETFRHVYCTLGVFHELSVAVFLVSLAVAACVAAGRNETKYYTAGGADPRASVAQKVLIPVVLLLSAGVAAPLFLLPYTRLAHSCTDPFRARQVVNGPPADGGDASTFYSDLYSTIVSALTYAVPVLILPLALPIACLRTCISRQCCVPRFKQPIGELIMTIVVCIIYLGSIVGVILPKLNEIKELEDNLQSAKVIKAPLLWEIANNAARPLVYFMTNPGVWDGLRSLCSCCCRKKHHLVNGDDMEEAEIPLSPVTTV